MDNTTMLLTCRRSKECSLTFIALHCNESVRPVAAEGDAADAYLTLQLYESRSTCRR